MANSPSETARTRVPITDHPVESRRALLRRRRRTSIMWGAVVVTATVAFVLGCLGYAEVRDPIPIPTEGVDPVAGLRGAWNLAYYSLQLFTLESNLGIDIAPPPILVVARALAVLCSGFAILLAAFVVFRSRFQNLRLRRMRGHAVVCGLGSKGFAVVRDRRAHGMKVVVIERDERNDDLAACRDLGAIVVIGDARDTETLRHARVERASLFAAVTGDDGVNVDISTRAVSMRGERPDGETFRCCAHLYDNYFYSDILREHRSRDAGDRSYVKFINSFESAARLVLEQHPLERDLLPENDARPVHLVIVGFGWLGRSIAVEAARGSHFANGLPLRLTIVDPDLANIRPAFERRYPAFSSICAVDWQARGIEDREALDAIGKALVPTDPKARPPITTVLMCREGDSANLAAAMTVHAWLQVQRPDKSMAAAGDVHIGVRVEGEASMASMLESWMSRVALERPVFTFGGLAQSFVADVLKTSHARAVHDAYLRNVPGDADKTRVSWKDLSSTLQESNEHQERHIPVKLRAARCECVPLAAGPSGAPEFQFTPDEVERLARIEHRRWNAERWLDGWQFGPVKDVARRISPWLVPWDDLPEPIKDYDREAVRTIPELLRGKGFGVRRC